MSIIERQPPPPASDDKVAVPSDRLRVVTAGRVGNMEARLGTSGFDVVAIADTEDELLGAISADEPDAIVVEADLCESLERVRDLAPDAVVIVVGDHTPAGALGRIERGVSGTVMAGLLHALVAEGVGGAVVWGLVPALEPPAVGASAQHVTESLLSAKAQVVRDHVVSLFRDHAGLVTAAGTVAATLSASVLLTMGGPRSVERTERAPTQTLAVAPPSSAVGGTSRLTRTPGPRPSSKRTTSAARADATSRTLIGLDRGIPLPSGAASPPDDSTPPPVTHTPPSDQATRPPGVAHGWDQRPPKDDDNGKHTGWSKGHGSGDHADGRGSDHAEGRGSDHADGRGSGDHADGRGDGHGQS